jgi:GT2 family glycosyltransferase
VERPLVSVLVLSRLRVARLRALLASVAAQDYAPMEVRVLANGCEQTAAIVRAEFPSVVLIELPENIGCAPGRNRIAADARGELLLFLDDDGELRATDIVSKCVAAITADARVGVLSMSLFNAASDEPTGWRRTLGRLPYPCYHASYAGGACLMRKQAFDAAGRYAEAFRGFGEEFDLTVRLYAAGWAVLHFPDAAFHHHVEKTDDEWRVQVSEGYAHLQYTIWRLYPAPWMLFASMKALATQVWIDVRHHGGRHLVSEFAKSHVWAHAGRRARRPVAVRALELLYFAKYFRVASWDVLERAPRGLMRRVLFLRIRRKWRDLAKLPLPEALAAADTRGG